jgi:2-oxoglutarate ferredoxin oxidoreductase subunit beta
MAAIKDFGEFETAWCPGCGNFTILKALKKALASCGLEPHNILLVSGIGQAAKTPHYLKANVFNGLHGRSLPVAIGARLVNTKLTVIAESGDGCMYGEGGNHFLAALRRNLDMTILVHDNQIYGLTKGQASPTTLRGHVTKSQPRGAPSAPFNPVETAVALDAGFVARGFTGQMEHLADLICQAIQYRGTAVIDILQQCVSFNKVNTYSWYKERCYKLPDTYDPENRNLALEKAAEFFERIPLGVLYRNNRKTVFEDQFAVIRKQALIERDFDPQTFRKVVKSYAV